LAALRRGRDGSKVEASLAALKNAASGARNTMPFIIDAVRAYATTGEVCDTFREVYGTWRERSVL
jgi:methylmalonyl-CoA mutase N-terminal domain/subunit